MTLFPPKRQSTVDAIALKSAKATGMMLQIQRIASSPFTAPSSSWSLCKALNVEDTLNRKGPSLIPLLSLLSGGTKDLPINGMITLAARIAA